MQCADLERYLDAFLDGRLGRTRTAVLLRHMTECQACALRVDKLRQFERDLNRRIRALDGPVSVWGGLDVHLVRSIHTTELPPPPPATFLPTLAKLPQPLLIEQAHSGTGSGKAVSRQQRRIAPRVLVLFIAVMTAGAAVEGARRFTGTEPRAAAELRLYREHMAGQNGLPLVTTEAPTLRRWLETQTGIAFPIPETTGDFRLVGGRIEHLGGRPNAVVAYDLHGKAALLYVQSREAKAPPVSPSVASVDGLSAVRWSDSSFEFSVLSALPTDELVPLSSPLSQ
jgi:anti-sigma factor RsiW